MKRLIAITVGIAIFAALVAFWLGSSLGTNPVTEARQEGTAAVVYASMTAAVPPTSTPAGTPTMSAQDILWMQATAISNNAMTQAANEQQLAIIQQENNMQLERERMQLEQARIEADLEEKRLEAKIIGDGMTATAIYNAQTAVASDLRTAEAIQTEAIQTAVKATEEAPRVQAEFEAKMAQEELDRRALAAEVRQAELAVDRTSTANMVIAFGPWVIGVVIIAVTAIVVMGYVKTRTHARDDSGRSQTIQKETKGGTVIVNPDQLETGIVKIGNDGSVTRYEPMDKEEQRQINRGRSFADMIGQLPQQLAAAGHKWIEKFMGSNKGGTPGRVFRRNDGSLASVIEEADDALLEEKA